MSRWIDADKCITVQFYDDEHEEWSEKSMTIAEFLDRETEEGCPSAEPKRPRGKWIIHGEPPIYVRECPECGAKYHYAKEWGEVNYCSNCGADCRGTENE